MENINTKKEWDESNLRRFETSEEYIKGDISIEETIRLEINVVNEITIGVRIKTKSAKPNSEYNMDYINQEHITCFSDSSMWESNDTWIPHTKNRVKCLRFILSKLEFISGEVN